jgi:3-phenylpropionate/trans-cinnamate dioxygenase ferredoxin reductase subunit
MTSSNLHSGESAAHPSQGLASSNNAVIIVGAGHAGVSTAASLRANGWSGRIIVIDEQDVSPYERPQLSKEFLKLGASSKPGQLRKESFFAEKGIELVTDARVTGLEPEKHRLTLLTGETLSYSSLVLATGATPRQISVPGSELAGVLQLKTLDDAMKLRTVLERGGRLAVIGAGYIGLEVAAAAAQYDCEVTVIETAPRSMNRTTCDDVAAYYQKLHKQKGVKFIFGATVEQLEGGEHVTAVVIKGNERIPADHVLVGIGVVPNQELAETAGIACDDGILVDTLTRTSAPDVYAVGDVTRFESLFDGTSQRLECISNAQEQAERLSSFLTGRSPKPREVPWFWTVQHGKRLQSAGVRSPSDDVIVRGDADSGEFTVCYIRGGKLAAVDTVGTLMDFRTAKKLIAIHAEIDTDILRDPCTPLSQTQKNLVEAGDKP